METYYSLLLPFNNTVRDAWRLLSNPFQTSHCLYGCSLPSNITYDEGAATCSITFFATTHLNLPELVQVHNNQRGSVIDGELAR
jgi:hypothetical protein